MRHFALPLLVLATALAAFAQTAADPALLAEVEKVRAIDNHTHVQKVVAPGEQDTEYDALPCEPLEASGTPLMARADNPMVIAAWKALYGYPYADASPAHRSALMDAKQRVLREQGDNFPNWALDKLRIEVMFANRIHMGRGLNPPRFRWVPYDDALIFPLNNRGMADTPDRKIFYAREEHLLLGYMQDLKLEGFPTTLDEYVGKLVVPTLERQKQQGAVAVKFEAAYLRALDFAPAAHDAAAVVYARFVRRAGAQQSVPGSGEYKLLQNYLFHVVAENAGRLGLAVHIHAGAGCGGYFQLAGANPLRLEADLDDPSLRKTTFVLIHGGWPFTKEMSFLLTKPNVYTDLSEMTWLLSPREMASNLRQWLEFMPEKVLFGTDLYAQSPEIGWEVVGWTTGQTARRALALALTGMMQDGEITRTRALELAHMVLHDNAAKLYGIQ
jgi:predicted TIM-barrel fold metal-dependent hydrolase